jgi:hypothetical protein
MATIHIQALFFFILSFKKYKKRKKVRFELIEKALKGMFL